MKKERIEHIKKLIIKLTKQRKSCKLMIYFYLFAFLGIFSSILFTFSSLSIKSLVVLVFFDLIALNFLLATGLEDDFNSSIILLLKLELGK